MLIITYNKSLMKPNPLYAKASIHDIQPLKTVTEAKEQLQFASFKGFNTVLLTDKVLLRTLSATIIKAPVAGVRYPIKEEYAHLFNQDAKLLWFPDPNTAWTHPADWDMNLELIQHRLNNVECEYKAVWWTADPAVMMSHHVVACDIETTGTDFTRDTIRTIGFSYMAGDRTMRHCAYKWEDVKKDVLKRWLVSNNKKVFHHATFDLTFLCRCLDIHPLELNGILDTRVFAYAAFNSTSNSDYSLGHLARAFSPDWKIDSLKVDGDALLRYNAMDCSATLYLYATLPHIPFAKTLHRLIPRIIGMQLNGWPVCHTEADNLKTMLEARKTQCLKRIHNKLPGLNPNSSKQLQTVFFDEWKLDSFKKTPSGKEETGNKALAFFATQLEGSPGKKKIIEDILEYKNVDKMLSTFIPILEKSKDCIRGSYTIGGTKSGRLSSSSPNMQNLPSGSVFAKAFKKCIQPPEGWVIVGADYKSLEDKVSALTTRDPEKLKVYTDGYDGHCLRAASYFDIPNDGTVASINAIAETHPDLRQKSKAPTFALTYQGTINTLIMNCGFDFETAQRIYEGFRALYCVSDEWVESRMEEGRKKGYVELAYGHRIQVPLLKASISGRQTPHQAQAEYRTAANALGQSYCMVTSLTAVDMYEEIHASGLDEVIKPIGEIHDATYWLVKEDHVDTCTKLLHKHMANHGLQELEHPTIKLDIDVSVFKRSWADEAH